MSNCTVYIDEAGDLGYQRGTQWFVLSAVIVDKSEEQAIRTSMSQIKIRLNVNEVHLKKIPDFMKRAYIVRELERENFTYVTTTFLAYELNGWGMRAPCYFKVLGSHIYRYNGKMERYGLKYFSNSMKPASSELKCHYACMKKERTPGATAT